ncbi:MAG TPA: hypothetical protein VNX40_10355 [Mucilaginibacter sp.]|jgi:hypothetical protein|nr:hypothetical protein [Mucilaginibacter sp.]
MYLKAKETARLYKLLSEKLGSDTTEAMFKYIDNKTERSVEATIKTLATKDDITNLRNASKDDITNLRNETKDDIANLRKEVGDGFVNLYKQIGENQTTNMKWMFIFWIGQAATTVGFILLFLKK